MQRLEDSGKLVIPRGFALFELGFRPFYLVAALFSALSVLGWVAMLEGRIAMPRYLPALLWHQHEMVFGFALAVIAGFLLTAGRAWTGLPTPRGIPLALLVALWIAARVALLVAPAPLAATVDAAFPFVLAAVMAWVIVRSRNTRNYFIIALLVALGAANIVFHLAAAGIVDVAPQRAVKFALYLVLTLVVVMAGRVVPAFTGNALPKLKVLRRSRLDAASLAVTLIALASDLVGLGAAFVAPAALAAAIMHALRQAGWGPLATLRMPILWSLHAGHAWLPLGFLLLALASLDLVAPAVASHVFALGVIGGMIIAMITRTALGHTGRALIAGRAETIAYALVHVAVFARVLAGSVAGGLYLQWISASALAWSLAFLLYFALYVPRLIGPRLDGKAG